MRLASYPIKLLQVYVLRTNVEAQLCVFLYEMVAF